MGWFWKSQSSNSQNPPQYIDENKNQKNVSPSYEIHSNYKTYTSSRSCYTDPQDPQYMICRQNTYDGKNNNNKETRVKINKNGGKNVRGPLMGGKGLFGNLGNQSDGIDDIDHMFQQFVSSFATPFFIFGTQPENLFGRFGTFDNSNGNWENQGRRNRTHNHQNHNQQYSRNNNTNDGNRYYSTADKDNDVRDL